ncbi:DUF2336 domain-containing protein [Tardiphaga sp.]|uniref:DUF2336 domain-containing protein n=1 Tax=Tardiphaga sp. TaxID=1926292 RepID=UPI002639012B|nr:DUF2336 domain-containing protein [Tardiphaga sp.]MDB5619166.1 hypothetical protein [Tardiphaga sp.]
MPKRTLAADLLDELQSSLAHGTVARRVETLRRVTDLFLENAIYFSNDQLAVFDDVFECLVAQMETSARVLLANRLAPVDTAPPRIVRALAFDDMIEVAAPLLTQSERLDDHSLIENARTKSQGHLLAISLRKMLSGAVTDVLVERGNNEVVRSTASNPGAEFSEKGYTKLLARAEQSDGIATCVGMRPSIPRHHYLQLIAKASASVRQRLEAANPKWSGDVSRVVAEVTRRARSAPAAISHETTIAHGLVRSLFEDGRLDETEVSAFAEARKFDETNAAIACLAAVPLAVAETMMIESRTEGIFILAKVAGFSWATVQAIIRLRETISGVALAVDNTDQDTYERLRLSTAQQVLRFHRMQQATSNLPQV